MSVKRQATSDLNHENWDQDDPDDQEEASEGFKMASKEVLEKRVIRTARRRTQAAGDKPNTSVFSGFTGFNKTQQSSFDFLSKLTNGNNAAKSNDESKVTTKPLTPTTTSSLFSIGSSISDTSTPLKNPAIGKSSKETLFGGAAGSGFAQSMFSSAKPNTPINDSPFKIPTTPSPSHATVSPFNTNAEKPAPQLSSTLFGSKTAINTNQSSALKSVTTTETKQTLQASSSSTATEMSEVQDENKLRYYSKLKSLNESVSEWIKMHVEKTPLCILSPIFNDYEKHLKELMDNFEKGKIKTLETTDETKKTNIDIKTTSLATTNTSSSLFSTSSSPLFSTNKDSAVSSEKTQSSPSTLTNNTLSPSDGFKFGIKPPTANPLFGIKTSPSASPFAASTTNGGTPFSFGNGKPFSFSSNVQKTEDTPKESEENEDEPPKVDYNPIVEENSVYEKKCKVFVKKDGNFADKGIGTLYLKKIEESGKHQLLVRANSALGNILLNFILSSSIPMKRMGKNNVMMVCIPTPDAKPPPTSILIRTKTFEEAEELFETINKYKL